MASPVALNSAGEPAGNPLPADLSVAVESQAQQETAPPSPEAEPQQQPQETSAPEQGQQALPADSPTSPAPNYDSKDFQDFLSRHGGDPEKAAKAFFETNNRAAAMAKALKERGVDPVTLQPLQPEQAPPAEETTQALPEPPPVELDAQAVDKQVFQALDNDPNALQILGQYNQITARMAAIEGNPRTGEPGEISSAARAVQIAEIKLSLPQIANDAFARSEAMDELREAKGKLSELKAELREYKLDARGLTEQYGQLASRYREQVRGTLAEQVERQRAETEYQGAVQSHRQEFEAKWPVALSEALKKHGIPDQLADRFRAEAKKAAKAYDGAIHDISGFVDAEAKAFAETLDSYHRVKSAQFGAQAAARTSTPGPTGQAAVAPSQPDVPSSEADITKAASQRFRDNLRAAIGAR